MSTVSEGKKRVRRPSPIVEVECTRCLVPFTVQADTLAQRRRRGASGFCRHCCAQVKAGHPVELEPVAAEGSRAWARRVWLSWSERDRRAWREAAPLFFERRQEVEP